MKKIVAVCLVAALMLLMVAAPGMVDAQATAAKKKTLTAFRTNDLDGNEVDLDGEQLGGKKVAFSFVTTWSKLAQRQTKAVAAALEGSDTKLVVVIGGNKRSTRELRATFGVENAMWLKVPTSVENDFRDTFEPSSPLNKVPALVIVDAKRRVLHASTGELTPGEIAAAVKAE